jgi:hypothetical protein
MPWGRRNLSDNADQFDGLFAKTWLMFSRALMRYHSTFGERPHEKVEALVTCGENRKRKHSKPLNVAVGGLFEQVPAYYRFAFFAFLAFFLGIILLATFLAFLTTDFAAFTTRLVTDFFFALLAMLTP